MLELSEHQTEINLKWNELYLLERKQKRYAPSYRSLSTGNDQEKETFQSEAATVENFSHIRCAQ